MKIIDFRYPVIVCDRPQCFAGKLEDAGVGTSGSRLGLSVNAGPVCIECWIDTGACVTLLHRVAFMRMCSAIGRARLLQPAPPLYNVSGKPIVAFG